MQVTCVILLFKTPKTSNSTKHSPLAGSPGTYKQSTKLNNFQPIFGLVTDDSLNSNFESSAFSTYSEICRLRLQKSLHL